MLGLIRRNMNATTMSTEFTAALFDEIIEEMLRDDWGKVDAVDAVELAEIVQAVNLARHHDGRPLLALPLPVQQQVNDCAKLAVHKGQGRHRPRDSYLKTVLKQALVAHAQDRQRKLHAEGIKNSKAKELAAEEAARDCLGMNLAANTSPTTFGAVPVQIPDSTFSFGVATSNYNTANQYMYVNGDTIASSPKSSGETDYTISYILNITNITPGGTYTMNQAIVATSTF